MSKEITFKEFLSLVQDYYWEADDCDFDKAFEEAEHNWLKLPEHWKEYLDKKLGVNRVIDVRYLLNKK